MANEKKDNKAKHIPSQSEDFVDSLGNGVKDSAFQTIGQGVISFVTVGLSTLTTGVLLSVGIATLSVFMLFAFHYAMWKRTTSKLEEFEAAIAQGTENEAVQADEKQAPKEQHIHYHFHGDYKGAMPLFEALKGGKKEVTPDVSEKPIPAVSNTALRAV